MSETFKLVKLVDPITIIGNGDMLKATYDPAGKNAQLAADSEVVHKTGAEAVAGVKTFSSNPVVSSASSGNVGATFINGSSGQFTQVGFPMYGSASTLNNNGGVFMGSVITDAGATQSSFVINQIDKTGAFVTGLMNIDLQNKLMSVNSTLYPLSDNTYTLGATSTRWSTIYTYGLDIKDGSNITLGTTTGTQIGTSTSQKLAFNGNTPIAKQGATVDLGVVLSNYGLRTGGTAYPITTSGDVHATGALQVGMNTTALTATTALTTSSQPVQDVNATSGAVNITPPSTTSAGYEFTITKTDASANAVTLIGTFNGTVNPTLPTQWKYMTFVTTGTSGNFRIRGNN